VPIVDPAAGTALLEEHIAGGAMHVRMASCRNQPPRREFQGFFNSPRKHCCTAALHRQNKAYHSPKFGATSPLFCRCLRIVSLDEPFLFGCELRRPSGCFRRVVRRGHPAIAVSTRWPRLDGCEFLPTHAAPTGSVWVPAVALSEAYASREANGVQQEDSMAVRLHRDGAKWTAAGPGRAPPPQ